MPGDSSNRPAAPELQGGLLSETPEGAMDDPTDDVSLASAASSSSPADPAGPQPAQQRPRRRAQRRTLHCPLHPEQKIFSVSPKHHLYVTDVGAVMLRGLSKRRADALLTAYKRVLPLSDEWIEGFWCETCGSSSWWHVRRHDRHHYSLSKVPRELWEQATGVIRPEGNPTVSQFTRRQARACGVLDRRQYRYL